VAEKAPYAFPGHALFVSYKVSRLQIYCLLQSRLASIIIAAPFDQLDGERIVSNQPADAATVEGDRCLWLGD
jgi:hypothetical protein